jgi:Uri superfamily endonuclease
LKGIYVLTIRVNKTISPTIGALGKITFPEGLYAYVGSAQNNLDLRVARHLRREKRLFWHIDYLLNDEAAEIEGVFFKEGVKMEECRVVSSLGERGEAIYGFGCSDCRCRSHLFKISDFHFSGMDLQPLNLV